MAINSKNLSRYYYNVLRFPTINTDDKNSDIIKKLEEYIKKISIFRNPPYFVGVNKRSEPYEQGILHYLETNNERIENEINENIYILLQSDGIIYLFNYVTKNLKNTLSTHSSKNDLVNNEKFNEIITEIITHFLYWYAHFFCTAHQMIEFILQQFETIFYKDYVIYDCGDKITIQCNTSTVKGYTCGRGIVSLYNLNITNDSGNISISNIAKPSDAKFYDLVPYRIVITRTVDASDDGVYDDDYVLLPYNGYKNLLSKTQKQMSGGHYIKYIHNKNKYLQLTFI